MSELLLGAEDTVLLVGADEFISLVNAKEFLLVIKEEEEEGKLLDTKEDKILLVEAS